MGSRFSYSPNTCNYNCNVCMLSGKDPTISGRFFIINDTQCKCNGCGTVFEKSVIYRPVITDASKINCRAVDADTSA